MNVSQRIEVMLQQLEKVARVRLGDMGLQSRQSLSRPLVNGRCHRNC